MAKVEMATQCRYLAFASWNIIFGKQPGEALNDAEGINTVRGFAQNVAALIKKLK